MIHKTKGMNLTSLNTILSVNVNHFQPVVLLYLFLSLFVYILPISSACRLLYVCLSVSSECYRIKINFEMINLGYNLKQTHNFTSGNGTFDNEGMKKCFI